MATTWDDVLGAWKGAGLPSDEADRLESVLKSADDYQVLDIDNEDCFVLSEADPGWYASIFYEAVHKVYTDVFSNFVTSCQSRYGFTPESWAEAYNTDVIFLQTYANEINGRIKDICDDYGAGEYSIKGPFDIDFDVPAFGMVDPDDPDYETYTFPDDWDVDAKSGVAGFPYFILNPFAGYVPSEEIIKTREHRLVNNVRKTIYRETSADLVKTADGGNVEEKLVNVSSPFLELGDLTDYIDDGTDAIITDAALIAKLNTALNMGFIACKIIYDGDEYLLPIATFKYAKGTCVICGYGGSQSPFVLNLFDFDGDDWTIYPNNINSIISI